MLDGQRPLDEAAAPAAAPRDRAFARLIALTVLRRMGQLDRLIAGALPRGLPRGRAPVGHLLRLGLAQGLFLGTPLHAVVATTLALADETGGGRIKGLIDATLRRLAAEGPAQLAAQDAARLNTPAWLWQRWVAHWGAPAARAIAEAHLGEPPLDLTLNPAADGAALNHADWAARLDAAMLPTGGLRRGAGGAVEALAGYEAGTWWVQDAAAALPARLLAAAPGTRVVELCAAPGGKTAQLAAAGADVIAVDRAAPRLETLQANLDRLSLAAALVEADAAVWRPPAPVSAVLLDAPCSATGTIRRHPDIARLKRTGDLAALAEVQRRLLANAAAMLAPGGRLVWCTCSLEPEEGEATSRTAADTLPLLPDPVRADELPGLAEAITPEGWVRTLPSQWADRGGLDGFHIARFRKIN